MRSERMMGASPSQTTQGSWVVVHDAWRDQYQLPTSFAEAGVLKRFVTDWYTPADHPLWRMLVKGAANRSLLGLSTRYSTMLPSALVSDGKLKFLLALLRRRLTGAPFDDIAEGGKGGRRAAKLANAQGAHLLAASYSAAEAFAQLRPGLARVLFQVHPQPRFLRTLYEQTMLADPDYEGLRQEAEFSVDEDAMQAWEREARLADHILCASFFSRRSLIWSGIPKERISVIPYGVDTARFTPGKANIGPVFKVLFVGQRVARKGLRTLLRLWAKLRPLQAELILAGGHQACPGMLDEFQGLYTEVPRVSADALAELYRSADLLVVPSLAEGFGHVYLEALACGTPVICSDNTGAADLITTGQEGWVVPAGDALALEECLQWALTHREQVRGMRRAARELAKRHTWERFRAEVRAEATTAASRVQHKTTCAGSAVQTQPVLCGEDL